MGICNLRILYYLGVWFSFKHWFIWIIWICRLKNLWFASRDLSYSKVGVLDLRRYSHFRSGLPTSGQLAQSRRFSIKILKVRTYSLSKQTAFQSGNRLFQSNSPSYAFFQRWDITFITGRGEHENSRVSFGAISFASHSGNFQRKILRLSVISEAGGKLEFIYVHLDLGHDAHTREMHSTRRAPETSCPQQRRGLPRLERRHFFYHLHISFCLRCVREQRSNADEKWSWGFQAKMLPHHISVLLSEIDLQTSV